MTGYFYLVGESPVKHVEREPRLWLHPMGSGNGSAQRLLGHARWDVLTYLTVFAKRTNVLRRSVSRWFDAEIEEARENARLILSEAKADKECRGIVALGMKSFAALSDSSRVEPHVEPLKFYDVEATRVALLPHTSGLNRWWNSDTHRSAAAAFLRDLYDEVRSCR